MSEDLVVSEGCKSTVVQHGVLRLLDMLVFLNMVRGNAVEHAGCHWQGDDLSQCRDRVTQHKITTQ